MRYFLTLVLLLTLQCSYAQNYAANLIPDSLKENANAVLRNEELYVEIKDIGKAVIHQKYAITILNEFGNKYAVYRNQYDKLVSLSDISGTLYDAAGNKIKSARRKDIYDYSNDGSSFFTDDRVKTFSFSHATYPYTVEFEDEQVYNGIYYLPIWMPVKSDQFAVQRSKLVVETEIGYELRFKQFNYQNNPVKTTDKKVTYSWEINNYKAFENDYFLPDDVEIAPCVMLAPGKFSISGYTGNMTTWDELGKFQLELNKDRDILPDAIKKQIHTLTDNITSDEEKVRIIYEYLQKNTRYISIQLGIGGWQPLPASFVAEKKYGDCKALSNFMISLLKEINIKAHYVVINAGQDVSTGLYEDFPCKYSNHIVSCVPLKNDTMWLECTSQIQSAGYMGTFTGNRKALLITDGGGVVVNTPKFIAEENKVVRKISASIDAEGNLKMGIVSKLTGTEQEREHELLHNATQEQRVNFMNHVYNLPTYTVDKIEYREIKGRVPEIVEQCSITAPAYANITGKRMFVVPNLLTQCLKLAANKTRTFDIVYKKAYTNADSIEIKIPDGYSVEMMPKNVAETNKFGTYKIDFFYANNTIKVVRYYKQQVNRYPASEYQNLVDFYEKMAKADRAKIVLIKQ